MLFENKLFFLEVLKFGSEIYNYLLFLIIKWCCLILVDLVILFYWWFDVVLYVFVISFWLDV